jgi:PBSX family phage terminase large subunit
MSLHGLKVRLDRLEESRNDELRQEMLRPFPQWLEPEVQRLGWASEISSAPLTEWKYDALPAQLAFHTDLGTPFKGYSGPIGSGKSYALVYEALLLSRMNPGLLGLVGAPTYRMLEDSTRRTFFEVLEAEGIGYDFNKQDNRLRFAANGSEILFRTMENPERLRGPNLAWFALDELTYTREEAWTRLLGRLRHPRAHRLCGCAVWTPKGYDWVHHRFLEQQSPDYRLVQATPKENVHLPEDFYDRLKDSYAELFYRQEVLGEYLDIFGGNAYYAFSDENIEPAKYNPNLPLYWALDFNVNHMSSVICQIDEWKRTTWATAPYECKKTVRVLDEMVINDSNTSEAAEEFIHRAKVLIGTTTRTSVNIYGDSSGNSRSSKSSQTDYELIRRAFQRHSEFNINMRQNSANPLVRDRVNTMNNALCSVSKERSVFIDPKCRELIKDLHQVRWKRDAAGNPVGNLDKSDPRRTHLSDALSYLVASEFGLHGPAGEMRGMVR